jgi:hypothetical protein
MTQLLTSHEATGWRVNRRFQFQKSRQPFICTHNETLSVVAVCVNNPDRSPVEINC